MATGAVDLETFETEAQGAIDGIANVRSFIDTYGGLVTGLGPHTHSLAEIERGISGALQLFNATKG